MSEIIRLRKLISHARDQGMKTDILEDAARRIEWLEQRLRQTTGEAVIANTRIEALEAALREIAAIEATIGDRGWLTMQEIAQAALAPELE